MRKWLRYGVAVAITLVTFLALGRTTRERAEEPRVRELDADATRNATSVRVEEARLSSLWTQGRFVECLAPAFYPNQAIGAQLEGAFRLTHGNANAQYIAPPRAFVSVRRGADSPGLQLAALLAV